MAIFSRFYRDNQAVTSIEYAIISSLISVAILVGIRNIGSGIEGKFHTISSTLSEQTQNESKGNKDKDHEDRGHGNDDDGVDDDNPGNGGGGPNAYK